MTGGPSGPGRAGDGERAAVRVFVSYAHDDAAHEERVRGFWWFLRAHGVDARLDQLAGEQRQDWAEWMTREVRDAAYVLVIASPDYKQRDLSVSHNRLGDLATAAGDLTAARTAYQAALDIAERLAAADPTNTGWQEAVRAGRQRITDLG
jgi:TIR domain